MFRTVLSHLLSSASLDPPSPASFMHCTTGNNRTGVFVSLLLLLLGVTPEDVVEEYSLSDAGLAPTRHINVQRLGRKKQEGDVSAWSEHGRRVWKR